MSEDNKALMRRWFEEVWNKGREDAIDELFAEEGL
ncbi:MAG: ester cyclase, partial [Rubrivivax sp.]|nr:ester cyclase [Pyrinomonadaceae bacterium]